MDMASTRQPLETFRLKIAPDHHEPFYGPGVWQPEFSVDEGYDMSGLVDVVPCEGGWCVRVHDTGEVLFFSGGGEAERRARKLAASAQGPAEVRVHDKVGRLVGRWLKDGALA